MLDNDLFHNDTNTNTDTDSDTDVHIVEPSPTQQHLLKKKIQKVIEEHEAQSKRTWRWYQDLKAKDSNKYWHPKTQVQMHKDAEALGDAFADGDFENV
jgi:hypothetical protein